MKDSRLEISCHNFLNKRYYFEESKCPGERNVYDIYLHYLDGDKYPFGVLQLNCENDLVKYFSVTKEEAFDIVERWVIDNVEYIISEIRLLCDDPIIMTSMFYMGGVNPHRVSEEEWVKYVDDIKRTMIKIQKDNNVYAYYNYKAINGFVD